MAKRTPAVEAAIDWAQKMVDYSNTFPHLMTKEIEPSLYAARMILEQSTPTYPQGFREGLEAAATYTDSMCVMSPTTGENLTLEGIAEAIRAIPVPKPSESQGWDETRSLIQKMRDDILDSVRIASGFASLLTLLNHDAPTSKLERLKEAMETRNEADSWLEQNAAPQVKGVGDESIWPDIDDGSYVRGLAHPNQAR